jgi:hypothetical protein
MDYKTFETPPPRPQQSTSTMTPEAQRPWDEWLQASLEIALEQHTEHLMDILGEIMGEVLSEERQRMREHVAKEVGLLCRELEIIRQHKMAKDAQLHGNVSSLVSRGKASDAA